MEQTQSHSESLKTQDSVNINTEEGKHILSETWSDKNTLEHRYTAT